jgi:ABC-type antimicrobial peptide transport system permease subunit
MILIFLKSIKHHWIEYFLTILMIAIVVGIVTVQRSLSSSAEEDIHGLAHKLGNNMLVLPRETNVSDFYMQKYGEAVLPASYLEKIRDSELSTHIKYVQSRLYGNLEINGSSLVMIGENSMKGKAVFSPVPSGNVVLGSTASQVLSKKQSDEVNIAYNNATHKLRVTSIAERPDEGLDIGLFTSLETSQEVMAKPGKINAMRLAGCWCSVDIPALGSQVETTLPGTKALTVKGMLKAQKGTVAAVKRYSVITYSVAVLLIAGIVIVLIASQVRRQMKEIGLLLAVGTSPWVIILFFTTTAGLIGTAGGLSGYLLGFPLTEKIAASLIGMPLPASKVSLMMVLALSSAISMVSAIVPALKAARLDPTKVLREV